MTYDLDSINLIKELLVDRKETVSAAESVTSGHIQAAFSAATEASMFFQGGITAYNGGQKCRHLDIEPINALKENCVSESVACQMATGANRLFLSRYGIGITGYATPVPEQGITDLFAFFAIAIDSEVKMTKKIVSTGKDGIAVQIDYTNQVIRALKKLVEER